MHVFLVDISFLVCELSRRKKTRTCLLALLPCGGEECVSLCCSLLTTKMLSASDQSSLFLQAFLSLSFLQTPGLWCSMWNEWDYDLIDKRLREKHNIDLLDKKVSPAIHSLVLPHSLTRAQTSSGSLRTSLFLLFPPSS